MKHCIGKNLMVAANLVKKELLEDLMIEMKNY